MLNKKQAFTFAELMISLVIIAVITLLLYPTISDLAPNNNKFLFKSTYKTITTIVSDYINSPDKTGIPVDSATNLCPIFCARLNTVTTSEANNACNNCTNFTTSNGMRWAFAINGDGYILVDVNASNNNTANGNFPAINNSANNAVFAANNNPWTGNASGNGIFYTDDTSTCDTFLFIVTSAGMVQPLGGVAVNHLESDD